MGFVLLSVTRATQGVLSVSRDPRRRGCRGTISVPARPAWGGGMGSAVSPIYDDDLYTLICDDDLYTLIL